MHRQTQGVLKAKEEKSAANKQVAKALRNVSFCLTG